MKLVLVFLAVFALGCDVSKSSHYNVEVKIGSNIAEKHEIASNISKAVWGSDLRTSLTEQIPELADISLEKVFGIKWQAVNFTTTEGQDSQAVFIQCLVKHSNTAVIDKVLNLCRNRIEIELSNYDL